MPDPFRSNFLLIPVSLLSLLSGGAITGLQVIWMRQAGFFSGDTADTAAWVVGGFFIAAAIGNKIGSFLTTWKLTPLLVYGCLEIAAGTLALSLTQALSTDLLPTRHPALFAIAYCALPSLASGAGTPFIIKAIASAKSKSQCSGASVIYGSNLVGAALGPLIVGIFAPIQYGYSATLTFTALALIGGGSVAICLQKISETAQERKSSRTETSKPFSPEVGLAKWVPAIALFSGVASLSVEVILIRILKIYMANSIYAVSVTFFAFIANLGLGAWIAAWINRNSNQAMTALAVALAWSGISLSSYPFLIGAYFAANPFDLSDVHPTEILRECAKIAVFLAPCLMALGMIFPLSWSLIKSSSSLSQNVGKLLFTNKLGSACGVILIPTLLIPQLGYPKSLATTGIAYCLIAVLVTGLYPASLKLRIILGTGLLASIATLFFVPRLGNLQEGDILIEGMTRSAGRKISNNRIL